MLKSLSQIMATIIAVGASLFAAYSIYLFSMKSDVESKIEREGYIILSILEKHTSQLFYTFSGIGNKILLSYLNRFPEYTRLDLIDKILNDAEALISDPSKKDVYELFKDYVGDDLPISGRLFVYALDEYIQALFPPGIRKTGLGYSYPYSYTTEDDDSKLLFPYGPKGVEPWLKEFKRIKSAVNIRTIFLNNFRLDLNKYIAGVKDPQLKYNLNRNNYQRWIDETMHDLNSIEASVRRINSLNRLVKLYSLKERLPNFKLILSFFILAFVTGVLAPLLIEGMSLVEREIVPLNITVLFVSILFIFLATYFSFKDLYPIEDRTPIVVQLSETEEYINAIKEGINDNRIVSYERINDFFKGVYKDKIPNEILEKMSSFSKNASLYNECINTLCKRFSSNLFGNGRLVKHMFHEKGGGRHVSLTAFFLEDNLQTLLTKGMIWVFSISDDGFSQRTVRLQIPSDDEEYIVFLDELTQLKTEVLKDSICNKCVKIIEDIFIEINEIKAIIQKTNI